MKLMKILLPVTASFALGFGLTACDDGYGEEAAEDIDHAVDETGDAFDEAGDDIEDAVDDTFDDR